MSDPRPVPVGDDLDVDVEFEATSWTFAAGHGMRLAVTGMDWPNTVAAPRPFMMRIDGDASTLTLPVASGPPTAAPDTLSVRPPEPPDTDVGATPTPVWRIRDDVLERTTSADVEYGSTYDGRHGTCTDRYTGEVVIDRRTWRQRATSSASYTLVWGDVTVSTLADVAYTLDECETTVEITLAAHEGDTVFGIRTWRETFPRQTG